LVDDEPEVRAIVTITYERFSITAGGDGMSYVLANDHSVKLQVAYLDAKGHPASVQTITWDSADATIAGVVPDPTDRSIVTVVPADNIGQTQIRALADVDLGEGVKPLLTVMDLEVVGGEAIAGTITPSGPATPITP
jgi:hypothetical protein